MQNDSPYIQLYQQNDFFKRNFPEIIVIHFHKLQSESLVTDKYKAQICSIRFPQCINLQTPVTPRSQLYNFILVMPIWVATSNT